MVLPGPGILSSQCCAAVCTTACADANRVLSTCCDVLLMLSCMHVLCLHTGGLSEAAI